VDVIHHGVRLTNNFPASKQYALGNSFIFSLNYVFRELELLSDIPFHSRVDIGYEHVVTVVV
jgi:hypothetical protein